MKNVVNIHLFEYSDSFCHSHCFEVAISSYYNLDHINTTTLLHPLNGPFSRTTQVIQYQKGKTNLHFPEARDSEWQ